MIVKASESQVADRMTAELFTRSNRREGERRTSSSEGNKATQKEIFYSQTWKGKVKFVTDVTECSVQTNSMNMNN